jgi:primosomal protein N' (replication factor Y) (superfamily II helicase)
MPATTPAAVLQIAVPAPLFQAFDYLPPAGVDAHTLRPGLRLRVPFGRGRRVGVLLGAAAQTEVSAARLKRALEILDDEPVLPPDLLELCRWAADYYHHPLGEVLATALPTRLREGGPLRAARSRKTAQPTNEPGLPPPLNPEQAQALAQVRESLGRFQPLLLEGVTGSGKTEVYLQAISEVVAQGRQALVLVPEIGLTPQFVARFRARLGAGLALAHSGLADGERLNAWLAARSGEAAVVIGTRSAVFTPLPRLGLVVIDEEHDASYKQQEGFRYSARDLAIRRAQQAGVPVLLGSATPSLESLHNAQAGRYRLLHLKQRAGAAEHPPMHLIDVRGQHLREGLSNALIAHVRRHLEAGGQALLFLNRRGFAPTLLCHSCGWVADCKRCDAHMTLHRAHDKLRCHHCGAERPPEPACPHCRSNDLLAVGQGTERVEQALQELFPGVGLARIDRDTTRRKGALDRLLDEVHSGQARLLIGTQMLAKGHDFPEVTLVGVLNADAGLFSADFRAPERMAQLITQVAGRAGRASRPGEVYIQTHQPQHPLLNQLIRAGYRAFAEAALEERREAGYPPYGHLALLRAESVQPAAAMQFLEEAAALARATLPKALELWGPVPAPMERRAGRVRAQLLLQSDTRKPLHALLREWVPQLDRLPAARRARWSLDVDPQDLM